jgi:hypothetical protein
VVSVSEILGRAEPTKALPTVTSGPPAEDLYSGEDYPFFIDEQMRVRHGVRNREARSAIR